MKYLFILSVLIFQADFAYAGAAVQRTRQIERQQEAYKEAVRQQMIQQRQQQEAQAYQQAVEQRRSQMQQAYRQAYQNAVENQARQKQQAYVERYEDALNQKANQERQVYQEALQQRAYQEAAQQKAVYEQAVIQAQAQQQAYQYAAQRQAYQQAAAQQQAYGQIAQQQAMAYGGTVHISSPYPDIPEEPQDVADINQIIAELDITSEIWPLIMDAEPKVMIIDHYMKRFAKQRSYIRKEPSFYVQMIDSMIFGNPEMLKTPLENILKVAAIAEYDFDNGQDKDRMARQILGETVYQENRKRLGR